MRTDIFDGQIVLFLHAPVSALAKVVVANHHVAVRMATLLQRDDHGVLRGQPVCMGDAILLRWRVAVLLVALTLP